MSRISTYEVVPVPKLADKLIGTSVGGEIEDITYNFTLSELLNLFIPNIPASGLQGVLDIGNTATQDINLFGTITTTYLDVTDTANLFITYLNQETHIVGSVYDSLDLIGAAGAVLTSTGSGVQWVTLPPIFTPNLQQVLTVGNTANLDIILSANIVALDINTDTETVNNNITIDGTITDGYSSVGTSNQVLSSTGTEVKWVNLPAYSATSPLFFNNITGVFSIQQAGSTQSGYLSSADWITFDGKQNAGNYITALTGQATANGPGSASIILNNSSVIAKVLTGLNVTGGSISAADSILTAFGKVQGQLNGLVGGVFFKGSWNALINNPTLTSSVGTQGWYYIVSVAGNTNLNGITDWQVGDWAIFNGTTWDKIDNTDSVTSVNGFIGAVNLTTDNIPEGATNLYYLDSRARTAISLTTIGTSGAATYNNTTGVFNIPAYIGGVISFNGRTGVVVPTEGDYTLTELGDVTITAPITGQVLKYNGAIWINDTDANTGTVTSVAALTLGTTGVDLSSTVANSTTTPVITLNVPTASATNRGALSSTDWSTFNSKESVLTFSSPLVRTTNTISIPVATTSVDGYLSSTDWNTFNNKQATISLTTTGTSGAATFIGNTLNIPQYQASGTYVTSVTGTSPIVSSGGITPAISIPAATGSVDGYLTSTDWTTFNNKANALSGTLNTVPKFTSASTIGDSNIKDNGSAVTVNATAGSFGALQVGNYNGNILMNTTNTSGGLIFQNTSSSNKLWDFSSYNNDINFNESGVATPVMTLKTGGNVGIKTTIPSFLLDVAGTFGATGIVTLGNLAGSGSRMVIADSLGVLSTQAITTGTVTAVTASSPLFSSGGNTPNITIQQSSGSQDGYLSSTDWTTFNNKQAAGNYITSLTGEATGSGPGAATVTLNNAAVTGKILTGINITGGTVLDTDSILIGFGKLQNQVNGLIGGSTYQGTWNANTNTPTLTSSVGTAGYYYIVSVAGNTNLNGITDWQVGDWAIFNGGVWQKVDNTDAVVSVNGQTGAVSLTTDNIPEGTTNLYYLDSRARAALSFAAGSGAYSSSTGVITIPTNTSQLTNGANFITLASLNGTSPIVYNNTTGNISINQSGTASNGYLSSTDWNTFNGKQGTITLTTTGTNGAATFIANTLNIPNYSTDLTGYVPYIGATTNLNLGAFNLTSTDVTANGNTTLFGTLTGTKTVSSGSPYSLTVTQNSTNASDTGDGALSVSHNFSGTGTGTELVTRSFIFGSNNSRTGGSVLSNGRVLYLVSSTQSGTTTTNLDQVYVEGGTMSGTVTNNRGVLVKTMQGTNQAAFVATGLTSSNRVHLLLGNYTLPTGAWGIYSALTDASYLQGNLLLGSATDDGVNKLQVTGATKITGQLTLGSTITNGTYTYTLPSATGTLALVGGSGVGTVTSVSFTLGSSGTDLNSSVSNSTTTPLITLNVPTASASSRGALSSTDWTTFNSKQGTITLTTTGTSGASTFISNVLNIPNYAPSPAARNEQTFTATAGQTIFSIAYTVGQLDVYYNGSKLAPAEFTATNGTSFTLATACFAGDIVDAVAYITGAGVGGSGTANELTYFVSSTIIGSLTTATYPSLTELSYVKGVTSAIQTQLNSKQATITLTTTGTSGAATFSSNTLNIPNYGSALSGYLPLTGGTLTGALGGTSASFSSTVTAGGDLVSNGGVGATRFILTSAGAGDALGILYNASSVAKIQLYTNGVSYFNGGNLVVGNTTVTNSAGYARVLNVYDGSSAAVGISIPSYDYQLGVESDGALRVRYNGSTRLTIASTGGATFTGALATNEAFTVSPASGYATVVTNGPSGTDWIMKVNGVDKHEIYNTGTSFNIYNSTTASVAMSILNSTGAATFSSGVTATSFGGAFTLTLQGAGANGISDGPFYRFINTTNSYQLLKQLNSATGEDTWYYNGSAWAKVGNLAATTGVYTPLSDITKKKDFEISKIGLNEILQLRPTLYRMKSESDLTSKQLGFLAQEVKEFIPQAYVESGDFIGLNYQAITSALVKAVQELSAKIEQLENK